MASSEMALIRSSLRLLRRSVTTRAIVAAERRSLPRAFATPAVRHLRTRATPPQRKPELVKDEPGLNTQLAHTLQESDTSDLVSEVNIPDDPNGVLQRDHPAVSILNNSSLVIQRQLEMMNVLVGFEQANRYIVMNGEGETVGYIAEQDHGIGRSIARQMARTHRSFTTYIFDKDQREVLRIHRPFAFINTKIRIYDAIGDATPSESTAVVAGHQNFIDNAQVSPLKIEEMKIIGECQSQWTALRRKYNLFSMRSSQDVSSQQADEGTIESQMQQFSMIDEPMLSWDFTVKEEDGKVIGSVNRNFGGFAREIFTDTGVYALRMDAAARTSALENADGKEIARYEVPGLTLDQRAVLIATAVSIDFDYFSRHSHSGGFMPMYIPMGGVAAEGAAATGGVEAVGGAVAGTAARGAAGAGMGAIETGAVGAGTMAGYEAMQRGAYGSGDDASPQAVDPQSPEGVEQMENQPGDDGVWGAEQDPWSESAPEGSEGGGGWISTIMDFFNDS